MRNPREDFYEPNLKAAKAWIARVGFESLKPGCGSTTKCYRSLGKTSTHQQQL